jgi:sugar-specific transcriptional regulator TrmB
MEQLDARRSIREALAALDLTGYETAVYLALLKEGRSNAKAIAAATDVPPTAVYPNLKSLAAKGIIQQIQGDIYEYQATKPSIALKQYFSKKHQMLQELEYDLLPELDAIMDTGDIQRQKEIVSLSSGSDAFIAILKELIDKTQKSMYIVGWRFRHIGSSKRSFAELNSLAKKGADVRIIVTNPQSRLKNVMKFHIDAGIKIRFYELKNFSIMVRDAEECKITLKSSELPERMNIHINDDDLSGFLNQYFLQLWEKSKSIDEAFPE